tara:strand:- start:548 stop:1153 length:606 start_codon:yes stop_codon:yes gene_type:complete
MALISLFENNYEKTLMWILIGVFLDSIDGLFARALGISSEIGKQLDSLCDVVSFGLVPGYFMYKFLGRFLLYEFAPLSVLGFLVTLASIYRLARFNITPSSQLDFQGMPTPAFALFVIGIPFIPYEINPIIMTVIVALLTVLMVSKIMLPSQKFVNGKPSNFFWIFAVIFIPILLIFRSQVLSLTVMSYAVFGILYMRLKA